MTRIFVAALFAVLRKDYGVADRALSVRGPLDRDYPDAAGRKLRIYQP